MFSSASCPPFFASLPLFHLLTHTRQLEKATNDGVFHTRECFRSDQCFLKTDSDKKKAGDSTITRSCRSHNRKTARVSYNNYTGDWTTFSDPGVSMVHLCKPLFCYLFVEQYIHLNMTILHNNST